MRVLVTGGCGFIGSHVVDKLRDRHVTVRVLDMVYPRNIGDAEFYQASILDLEAVRMSLNGVDAVIHLAAVADVKDVESDPHYAEAINVRGTVNVLEAMRLSGVVKRLVFGSTTWVYSDAEPDEVDEDTPLGAPAHLYTATKIAGEYYCRSYQQMYGLEPTVLRFGIPYGPRGRPAAVVPIFVRTALSHEPLTIAGDGSQFRRFVYVEDLAEGIVSGLQRVAVGKTYNLDGKQNVTILEIAETVKRILGEAELEYVPARTADFAGKQVDSSRALKELGWEPRTGFEEGVRKYIDWYVREQDERTARWGLVDEQLKA